MTALLVSLLAAPADRPVSFLADVAPVLRDNCFACHNGKKASGRYDMTTAERLLAGGSNGPAIVPGKPAESEFHALPVTDEGRHPPPRDKGTAVPAAQAAAVARWIAGGARLDPGLDPAADLTRELLQTVETHADWVQAVGFSRDGARLFTASRDRTAKVWDLAARKPVVTFPDHREPVTGVATSADGRSGFSVGADKLLREWEAGGEGKQVRVVGGHPAAISRLVDAPTGDRLFTAADGSVKSWAVGGDRSAVSFAGPGGPAVALAAGRDGRHVAVGSHAGEVWVWRVERPEAAVRFNVRP